MKTAFVTNCGLDSKVSCEKLLKLKWNYLPTMESFLCNWPDSINVKGSSSRVVPSITGATMMPFTRSSSAGASRKHSKRVSSFEQPVWIESFSTLDSISSGVCTAQYGLLVPLFEQKQKHSGVQSQSHILVNWLLDINIIINTVI